MIVSSSVNKNRLRDVRVMDTRNEAQPSLHVSFKPIRSAASFDDEAYIVVSTELVLGQVIINV